LSGRTNNPGASWLIGQNLIANARESLTLWRKRSKMVTHSTARNQLIGNILVGRFPPRGLAFFLLLFFVGLSADGGVLPPRPVGVDARLVSEAKTIVPGQTFTVALSLKHEEGFHTYWVNPGIVGIATVLNWTLPEGFTAGKIQWQAPERVTMVVYNAHGYNGDALLLIDITAPETLPKGPVTLKAGGAWMACAQKSCCNVGYQELEVTVNTGKEIEWDEEIRARIKQARSKLPKPVEGWEYSASRSGDKITLKVRNKKGLPVSVVKGVYFYSEHNHIDTLVEQQVTADGSEVTVVLPINKISLDRKIEGVKGLFYHPVGWPGSEGRKYLPVEVGFN